MQARGEMTPACPRRHTNTHTQTRTNISALLLPQSLTVPVVHAISFHTYKYYTWPIFNLMHTHIYTQIRRKIALPLARSIWLPVRTGEEERRLKERPG